mgnify:CR=1 FL=1
MRKRTGEVLKAIRWWIGMAVGLLVFFYLWSLVFKEDSFFMGGMGENAPVWNPRWGHILDL